MSASGQLVDLAVRPVSILRAHITVPVTLATCWALMATLVRQQVTWSWECLLSLGS